ncbi:MAG: translocation/assembly module TamB domain-containing protein [Candidatus Eremiobacteraeota bacterium]|nr:translocation/assembly module TamB domain-containing protein [Candidatus Eremiobacteraeota bacterium]
MKPRTWRWATLAIVVIAVASAAFAWRAVLGRALLAGALDVASGDRIAFDGVQLGSRVAILDGARVDVGGAPLLRAARITLHYDLPDLMPGGRRRYGLEAVELVAPQVTLERRPDGSFALRAPGSGGAPTVRADASPSGAPLRLAVRVRGGTLTVLDPSRRIPSSRRLTIGAITGWATIDDAARTVYRFSGNLADDRAQRLTLAGAIDVPRGYAVHHLQAARVAFPGPANYFVNTPSAQVEQGIARDLDARVYGFAGRSAGFRYHVVGSARVSGGALRVPGMNAPLHDIAGPLDISDSALTTRLWRGFLGTVAVRLAGGLYGWNAPAWRVGVVAPRTDLAGARTLFAFSRHTPLDGVVRAETLLEGPVAAPAVITRAVAPRLRYGNVPLTAVTVRGAYYDRGLDVLDGFATYGGLAVRTGGVLTPGNALQTRLIVAAHGPAARIPYLAALAPAAEVAGVALLTGNGLRFDARGSVAGSGGGTALAGAFHIDPGGDGTFGPLTLERDDGGRLAGAFGLHRSTGESGFWLSAHDYPFAGLGSGPRLPAWGIVAPTFAGRLNGQLAGAGPPSAFRLAGTIEANGLRVGGVTVDDAVAAVAGSPSGLRLGRVIAHGPWGAFAGEGSYVDRRLALAGRYDGSFARLAVFTGQIPARGLLSGPVALLIDPERTVVQIRDARTRGATVAGVALDGLQGTLGVASGGRLRVYGATARLGGGLAAAAGELRQRIGVSLGDVATAHAIRVPNVRPGRLSAIGIVTLAGGRPEFDGGAAVADAQVRGEAMAGNGDVAYSAARLGLSAVDGRVGTALGRLDGTLLGPGTPGTSFALGVRLNEAPLEPLLRGSAWGREDIAGTAAADVRVTGTPSHYTVSGRVHVPEGTVHGLAFTAFDTQIELSPSGVAAHGGTVTVGSTRAAFAGSLSGAQASAQLLLPRADLSDFDDYFDAGDALAGRGRVAVAFAERGALVSTSADVALRGVRYRRLQLGDLRARWASHGRSVAGNVAFGGPTGTARTAGTVLLPPAAASPSELVAASVFRGAAQVRGLDLGVWLPALGYALPVGGRVAADATIVGRLSDPDVTTTASLVDGSIGTFPVRRLRVRASSTLRRTRLESAELALPSLEMTGSGNLGFGPRDPLNVRVHAKSPNLATLATRLFGSAGLASGAGEADVTVRGTRRSPVVTGGFDVENATVRGVAVPRTLGEFSLHGRDVVLSGVEVAFAKGALDLAGSVPFEIAPFGFGPAHAPVALQGELRDLDLGDFAPLLPPGSMLGGTLTGGVAVEGTAGSPRLAGSVTLSDGSLRTPAQTIPLERIGGSLSLAGRTATLSRLHAEGGGGTLDAQGWATFPDLDRADVTTSYALRVAAKALRLNLPAYGGGQVDGALSLARPARGRPVLAGGVELSDATIPFSALLLPRGSGTAPGVLPPDLALDFGIVAGRNVRVRSANVDIGARGSLQVAGDLALPQPSGLFTSTGGTLTYFNTVFRLEDGTVRFAPDFGATPILDAVATTHVLDPDPNTVRNAAGSADVTLSLAGPVTNLSIDLTSQPAYDRQQILGLLLGAPALGASNLFGETAGSPTLYGSNATAGLSPGVVGNRNTSGELSVAEEAFGVANAQFTRTLLAPFETSLAEVVGLSNINLNVDYTGNVGVQARKHVGTKLNALFGTSFGYPYRQTFGFEYRPNAFSAAQVTVFQTLGATGLNSLTPTTSITNTGKLQAAQPQSGTTGVSFSLQRLFP